MVERWNVDHGIPCRNPSCRSFMRPHFGCKCGHGGPQTRSSGPSGPSAATRAQYAHGGEVNYCSALQPHQEGCEFFIDGGRVEAQRETLDNPDLTLDHAIVSHGLAHLLTKTGHTKSEDPSRPLIDHIDHAKLGRKELESHSKNLFETGREHKIKADPQQMQALSDHLNRLQENPQEALDVGGDLGKDMPVAAGILGAKAATIMNQMKATKPTSNQLNPMSPVIPPTRVQNMQYRRQLELAEKPALLYQRIKEGRVQPEDVKTVQAIYPKLFLRMQQQATEALIDAQSGGKKISYRQRMGLGLLLGQPLNYSETPEAAQAIIRANSGAAQEQQGAPEKGQKKSGATAAALKQINKADQLAETPIDASLIDMRKD